MTTVSLQLPIDAEPGDFLTFSAGGQELEIEVPLGSKPGDVLEIQLGGSENGAGVASENDKSLEFQMRTGEKIVAHTAMPLDEKNPLDDGNCDGTHAMIWPAARALVNFINKPDIMPMLEERKIESVLELGAGLGVCGLAFGTILSDSKMLNDAQVMLTDMPSAIPLLSHNIQQNQHLVKSNVQISTAPLVWHSNPMPQIGSPDWMIGSDLLYNPAHIPALVATIRGLSSTKTRILLAVRWRKPEIERSFFMQLSDVIKWRLVDGVCPLAWQDYGNPACLSSNSYFSQTMVGVEGKPTPLSAIDESCTEKMSNEEFEAWERLQIQVYLGENFMEAATLTADPGTDAQS